MAIFKEVSTNLLVYRTHAYNTEVLDGSLIPISETSEAHCLVHTPNNDWSYNVNIIKTAYPDILFDEYLDTRTTPPETPAIFNSIILKEDMDEYINTHKYTFINTVSNFNVKENTIQPFISLPPKRVSFKIVSNPRTGIVKLVRESETPIYISKKITE